MHTGKLLVLFTPMEDIGVFLVVFEHNYGYRGSYEFNGSQYNSYIDDYHIENGTTLTDIFCIGECS